MKQVILIAGLLIFGMHSFAAKVSPEAAKKAPQEAKKAAPADRKSASSEDARPLLPTHFEKGWRVEVMDYDVKSDIFELAVKGSGEEEAGPFYFTLDEVVKGKGDIVDPKSLSLQKKKDLVGAEFELKEDIRILTFEEYLKMGGDPNTF